MTESDKAKAYMEEMREAEKILGLALGYPRYCDDQKNFPGTTDKDGVCIGEHTIVTLASEAVNRITELLARIEELEAQLQREFPYRMLDGEQEAKDA